MADNPCLPRALLPFAMHLLKLMTWLLVSDCTTADSRVCIHHTGLLRKFELVNGSLESHPPIDAMSACSERFTAAVPSYICRTSQQPDLATFSTSPLP